MDSNCANAGQIEATDGFIVLDDGLLPPVNEFKRFTKIFFNRKIVLFGFILLVLMLLMAAFAKAVAPFAPNEQDLKNVLALPGGSHLLGTDALGRDLLSRIIFGSQIAILIGVVTVLVSSAVGSLIGLVAGFAGGLVDDILMRITDAIMAIPSLILSLLVVAAIGNGVPGVVVAIAVSFFPGYIRLMRGQVLSLKENDYVLAERAMGARWFWILLRHILPNCLSPLIVTMTMMMGGSIMAEAGMSFLGIGIVPPTATWGSMCYDGYKYLMTRPLLSIAPGFAIMLLVFALNMVGDGLRDALDPKLRGTT